jgi:hypothetical protein
MEALLLAVAALCSFGSLLLLIWLLGLCIQISLKGLDA